MLIASALLLGGGAWHASQHRPTGPAEGVKIGGTAIFIEKESRDDPIPGEISRNILRFGTFNLHGCKGEDGRVDIARTALCLKNLDFVALQEVHGSGFFGGEDQTALLGKQLKMAWLFAPAVRQWYSLESGNGFLTNLPVSFWQRIPLASHRDYSYRNAVLVGVKHQNEKGDEKIVNILLTHINRRYDEDRQAQLRAVIALFLSLREPAVLLGDLNSTKIDPQIADLIKNPEVTDAVGQFLGPKDKDRIDWIFCRGLKCLRAGIMENDASDHPMVFAEMSVD